MFKFNGILARNQAILQTVIIPSRQTILIRLFILSVVMVTFISGNPSIPGNEVEGPLQSSSNNNNIKISSQSLELTQSINIQRQEYLQRQCTLLGYPNNSSLEELTQTQMRHMIVDQRRRLLYCYVPKVACTNWKRLLLLIGGRWPREEPIRIPGSLVHSAGIFLTLNDLNEERRAEVMSENYTRLIIVRHPFERLLSAFRNKLEEETITSKYFQRRIGRQIIKAFRPHPSAESLKQGNDVQFHEFVKYLLKPELSLSRDGTYNEHWEPITKLCNPCVMKYNVIGKYETLLDDSALALHLVGADGFSFPGGQKVSHTRRLMRKYFAQLNLSAIRGLFDIYAEDLRLFDYNLDEFLGYELG